MKWKEKERAFRWGSVVDSGYQRRSQSVERGHGGQTEDKEDFSSPRTEKVLASQLPGGAPRGHLWIESESLLSTPHSLFFHLASLHGPGQSWGEVTTLRTQGPQPGPPGVRDQESEWRVNFTILQWAHSSISAWKISWQAIVHEVTKSLPRLSNWVYCSVYQRSISENQHAECKSTLEPDKNLTSQFSPVYNEDLWLSYWTGWKIKGNDAQRGFWHTRSVQ